MKVLVSWLRVGEFGSRISGASFWGGFRVLRFRVLEFGVRVLWGVLKVLRF